jgi:hypothetical protein
MHRGVELIIANNRGFNGNIKDYSTILVYLANIPEKP